MVHKILGLQLQDPTKQIKEKAWTPITPNQHREGLGDSYLRYYTYRLVILAATSRLCTLFKNFDRASLEKTLVRYVMAQLQVPEKSDDDPIFRCVPDISTESVGWAGSRTHHVIRTLFGCARNGILANIGQPVTMTQEVSSPSPLPAPPTEYELFLPLPDEIPLSALHDGKEETTSQENEESKTAPEQFTSSITTTTTTTKKIVNYQQAFLDELNPSNLDTLSYDALQDLIQRPRSKRVEAFRVLANTSGRIQCWTSFTPLSSSSSSSSSMSTSSMSSPGESSFSLPSAASSLVSPISSASTVRLERFSNSNSSCSFARLPKLMKVDTQDPLHYLCLTTPGCELASKQTVHTSLPPPQFMAIPLLQSCLIRTRALWGHWWNTQRFEAKQKTKKTNRTKNAQQPREIKEAHTKSVNDERCPRAVLVSEIIDQNPTLLKDALENEHYLHAAIISLNAYRMFDSDAGCQSSLIGNVFLNLKRYGNITREMFASPWNTTYISHHSIMRFDKVFCSLGLHCISSLPMPLQPTLSLSSSSSPSFSSFSSSPSFSSSSSSASSFSSTSFSSSSQIPSSSSLVYIAPYSQTTLLPRKNVIENPPFDTVPMMLGFYINHDLLRRSEFINEPRMHIVVAPDWPGYDLQPTDTTRSTILNSHFAKLGIVQDMYKESSFCTVAIRLPSATIDFKYGAYWRAGVWTPFRDTWVYVLQNKQSRQIQPITQHQLHSWFSKK